MSNPNVLVGNTSGLSSHPNELAAQPGSTSVADNVVFNRDGLPERRNGFKDFSANLPDFAPEQILVGSNGVDRYVNIDGGLWYYDTTSAKFLRKSGDGTKLSRTAYVWSDGSTIFVSGDHCIETINAATGARSVLAGRRGAAGNTDATGDAARINTPQGIWGDGAGSVYFSELSGRIKRVTAAGVVTTIATIGGNVFAYGIWGDGVNTIYVANDHPLNRCVQVVTISSGAVASIAGGGALAQNVQGIWGDGVGFLYVTDTFPTDRIARVTYAGVVTTAVNTAASPRSLCGDGAGNLYYATIGSPYAVRRATTAGADAAFVGGVTASGFADGFAGAATFSQPGGVFYRDRTLLVCDQNSSALRKVYTDTAYVVSLTGTLGLNSAFQNAIVGGPP